MRDLDEYTGMLVNWSTGFEALEEGLFARIMQVTLVYPGMRAGELVEGCRRARAALNPILANQSRDGCDAASKGAL